MFIKKPGRVKRKQWIMFAGLVTIRGLGGFDSSPLGIVCKPGIFFNYPKSRYLFFPLIVFSAGELPVDKK